jgi:hypothetical protein
MCKADLDLRLIEMVKGVEKGKTVTFANMYPMNPAYFY